ncbi:MAG: Ig-like domain-containing protein [Ferruginibacter sp.]
MKPSLPLKGIKHSALVVILCLSATFGFTRPGNTPSLSLANKLFNSPPVAGDDYAHLRSNSIVTGTYIQNDFDPDGDSLSINGITINTAMPGILIATINTLQGGSIDFFSNGLYTYTPSTNFIGNDQVVYQICDVTSRPLCTTATVYIEVRLGTILPLNISSFSGKKAGKDILLQWTTAQENNSDHFEIQHSDDNAGFLKIASITAQGYSNTTANYSFVHYNPTASINYYRVKLVNKDGSAIYSKVIAIKGDGTGVTLQTVYPNPFHDKLELAITTDQAGIISIQMYDMSGQLVLSRAKQTTKGLNVITLNGLSMLRPGNYFIDVNGSNKILQAKLYKAQ